MGGQDLDGDRPLQPGVGGFVDLAHAPGPDGGLDLIRAEAGAALQGHILGTMNYRRKVLDQGFAWRLALYRKAALMAVHLADPNSEATRRAERLALLAARESWERNAGLAPGARVCQVAVSALKCFRTFLASRPMAYRREVDR